MSLDDRIPAALQAPDSPFAPGTNVQFAWDSVSLTSILTCPRKYQLSIIEGRTPKNPNYGIALTFGIAFHYGLERYHKARFAGRPHSEAMESAIADVFATPGAQSLPTDDDIQQKAEDHDPDDDDGIDLRNSRVRTRYYLARSLVWYLDHYGSDDDLRTLALPSGAPAVEVSFRVPLGIEVAGNDLILCGHIDRAVDFNGYLYPTDYKTAKSLTKQWKQMFDLSHQMSGYSLAGQIIFDRPTKGIIIDGIALQVGGIKLARHFTSRTSGQVHEYISLLGYATTLAQRLYETYGSAEYPMNTAGCYFCEYREVCSKPPEVRQSYIDMWFDRGKGWNPLANR